MKELDRMLSESPELKNMSMEEIIGMLNLSDEDKKQLQAQVAEIMKSGDIDLKSQELSKNFPAVDPAMENIMKEIELEFAKNPGIREEFQTWMSGVQQALGTNLEKMSSMSEEEVDKIAMPPPRLRAVMDRLIPDTDKMNTLNLDEGMKMDVGEDGEPIEVEEIPIRKE